MVVSIGIMSVQSVGLLYLITLALSDRDHIATSMVWRYYWLGRESQLLSPTLRTSLHDGHRQSWTLIA